jgi:hypothetical protein
MPIVSAAIDTFLQGGALVLDENGAASTPPLRLSGTLFTGGSGTTTKPSLLVEPAGTSSTGWDTGGTLLGLNAPSGFSGKVFDVKNNNVTGFFVDSAGAVIANQGLFYARVNNGPDLANISTSNSAICLASTWKIGFAVSGYGMTPRTFLSENGASVMALSGASAGATFEMTEMTAPSAPAANKARIYAEDNGSGKTRLMVLFPTGAAQQIAIEP